MFMIKFLGLLVYTAVVSRAAPLASVHVKFVSPPHVYEHGLTTDGGNTISQKSYLSVGRRTTRQYGTVVSSMRNRIYVCHCTGQRIARVITPQNAESLWPVGVFIAPVDINDLGYSSQDTEDRHVTPDFSDGLAHPDPLLLNGDDALRAIKYLYGRGELFYHDIPHVRAILMNQEERKRNGLHGNILSSLRPDSPFYRKVMGRRNQRSNNYV